jgi:hypothetical protein
VRLGGNIERLKSTLEPRLVEAINSDARDDCVACLQYRSFGPGGYQRRGLDVGTVRGATALDYRAWQVGVSRVVAVDLNRFSTIPQPGQS